MKSTARTLRRKKKRDELYGRWYHRRFVIPNAVTIGNMFCGFLAIMYSASGRFDKASLALIFAILLDGVDGRVARRLNATSKFGVEFDSFSDLVSFGVAPAILMWHWVFQQQMKADEFGVLVVFFYAVCAAVRLARFNIADPNLKSFTGLPSPGAAGVVAAIVNFAPFIEPSYETIAFATVILGALGYLMVSELPYGSIKQMSVGSMKVRAQVGIALLIALTWYNSAVGFLVLSFSYGFSGLISGIFRRKTPSIGVSKIRVEALERDPSAIKESSLENVEPKNLI